MIKNAFDGNLSMMFSVPEINIELRSGERYAGSLLNDDGKPSHHLILLPGESERITWNDAQAWASKHGGELPTSREQSLLFSNLKSEFKEDWYWSGKQYSDGAPWFQEFLFGGQGYSNDNSYELRAPCVRRINI